jgi:hypothetical protein
MTLRTATIRLAYGRPTLRPSLLPMIKGAMGQYVDVKELPASVRDVLKVIKYGRRDISVSSATTYQLAGASQDGRKEFVAAVNLATGRHKIEYGSWGGPNMFNPGNQVDMDMTPRPIQENMVVVSGSVGGGPTYASLSVHPKNLQKLLGSGDEVELSDEEKSALRLCAYKSGYRKDEFRRAGLGAYSAENPYVVSLAAKGMLKITRGGAVSVTTKGRNVR